MLYALLPGMEFAPVSRVRRAGSSVYDLIDAPDFTTDEDYFEHGISRVHGFLTEFYVEEPRYLIKVPPALRHVGVLLEPTSVAEKASSRRTRSSAASRCGGRRRRRCSAPGRSGCSPRWPCATVDSP